MITSFHKLLQTLQAHLGRLEAGLGGSLQGDGAGESSDEAGDGWGDGKPPSIQREVHPALLYVAHVDVADVSAQLEDELVWDSVPCRRGVSQVQAQPQAG